MKQRRGSKVLLDFNAAIDFTYGIFRYMVLSKKFKIEYFKANMVRASDAYYKNSVIASKDKNPLKLLLVNDKLGDNVDSVYKDLCTKFEDAILKHSRPTDVLRLTYTWKKAKDCDISCCINCKDTIQYNYLKRIVPNDYPIIVDGYDTTDYDIVIVRDVYDLELYKNLKQPHLCIYLLNIALNYKDNGNLKDEAYAYFPALPKTIDMYTGFSYCLPPLKEEEEKANG